MFCIVIGGTTFQAARAAFALAVSVAAEPLSTDPWDVVTICADANAIGMARAIRTLSGVFMAGASGFGIVV
jgi:hypothetical protein